MSRLAMYTHLNPSMLIHNVVGVSEGNAILVHGYCRHLYCKQSICTNEV